MSGDDMRALALRLAVQIHTDTVVDTPVMETAEKFYRFLQGRSQEGEKTDG